MEDILDIKMPPKPAEENITMKIEEEEALKETPSSDEEDERPTIPDEEIFPEAPKVKAVKKERSEKQLAHLKKMRIAKELKKKEKEEWLEEQKVKQKKIVKQEKKAEKKKKKRPPTPDPSSSEDESSEEEQVVQRVRKENPIFHKLTAGEIRAIQRDAISDYDMLRKSRKMKKEEHYRRMNEEHEIRNGMHQMTQPDNDPWSSAFNFS